MPKETFHNLPDKKRKRIIDAARDELSAHDFSELSINRIVKDASISRGSFYMYFDDKHDLMEYLVGMFAKRVHHKMMRMIKGVEGCLDTFAFAFQSYLLNLLSDSWNQNLMRHMMLYFQTNVEHNFRNPSSIKFYEDLEASFLGALDDDMFKQPDYCYKRMVIRLILSTIHQNIMEKVVLGKTQTEIDAQLAMTMDIIKTGYRQKESD